MPVLRYYRVSRWQEVIVTSAYGELVAMEAGIAAMDGDGQTLEAMSAGGKWVPKDCNGPAARVREVETVKVEVENRDV